MASEGEGSHVIWRKGYVAEAQQETLRPDELVTAAKSARLSPRIKTGGELRLESAGVCEVSALT